MLSHLDTLRSQASSLPQCPGVYFWRDGSGRPLYIGKAVNLRSRVMSYFSAARHSRRTRDLLAYSEAVTCEVTSTELEALFRESALIKAHRPFYNRALLSPRKMWYLKLDQERTDPYLEVVRQAPEDGSIYFGPFPTSAVARETLAFVHDVLPLRKCAAAKPRCRPCIYFQMHKCAAPLLDETHRRKHEEAIDRLFDLLDGRTDRVTRWLEHKRDRLSESLLFEGAAEIQQRLEAVNDSERYYAILRAAMQCRCVLILDRADTTDDGRLLLVAHGHVLSVLREGSLTVGAVGRWVRAHEAVIAATKYEQSQLDAASVLQQWLRSNRNHVRWVTLPYQPSDAELTDRVSFVLHSRPALALAPA